ncbi:MULTISPECIES: hypothetical protein [Neobacillus]|uniref:Uncharacterized protein n=1 Tax=Neobacillus rhizophilus TaxID=2833579 RepID=A0A942YUI6_9BACI|nr:MULTISPECIES: hypothetical protein [Neobacillus]MBS4214048.1 hypothetical protein [Neobacillus rhizophilus]MBU8917550.1 hypothetical protein [Bacillus sp. FJAT-29953]
MGKYKMSKTIGMILGTIMIVATLGYGLLYLLGTSLGKALGSEMETTARNQFTFVILFSIGLGSVITGAGSFGIKFKGWRYIYIGFCMLIGVVLLFTFFISRGAIGTTYEFLILCLSILYFLLGYLVIKEK